MVGHSVEISQSPGVDYFVLVESLVVWRSMNADETRRTIVSLCFLVVLVIDSWAAAISATNLVGVVVSMSSDGLVVFLTVSVAGYVSGVLWIFLLFHDIFGVVCPISEWLIRCGYFRRVGVDWSDNNSWFLHCTSCSGLLISTRILAFSQLVISFLDFLINFKCLLSINIIDIADKMTDFWLYLWWLLFLFCILQVGDISLPIIRFELNIFIHHFKQPCLFEIHHQTIHMVDIVSLIIVGQVEWCKTSNQRIFIILFPLWALLG